MGLPVPARAFAGNDPILISVMDNPSHLGTLITVTLDVCHIFNTNMFGLSVTTEYCYILCARHKSPLKLLFFPL